MFVLVYPCAQVESDDDIMWTPDVRESDEDLAARGMRFLKWCEWLSTLLMHSC